MAQYHPLNIIRCACLQDYSAQYFTTRQQPSQADALETRLL